jgi:hypothetical protein
VLGLNPRKGEISKSEVKIPLGKLHLFFHS